MKNKGFQLQNLVHTIFDPRSLHVSAEIPSYLQTEYSFFETAVPGKGLRTWKFRMIHFSQCFLRFFLNSFIYLDNLKVVLSAGFDKNSCERDFPWNIFAEISRNKGLSQSFTSNIKRS